MDKECQTCGGSIDTSKNSPKQAARRMYCSSSCSARMNGVVFPKRGKRHIDSRIEKLPSGGYRYCLECQDSISVESAQAFCTGRCREEFWTKVGEHIAHRSKGCCVDCGTSIAVQSVRCRDCHVQSRTDKAIQAWLSGEWSGAQTGNEYILSRTVRKYLLEEAKYACVKCGFDTRHPDGQSILEINHINGIPNDHRKSNVEVLCPNCHALTPCHGGRNKGHGRPKTWVWTSKEAVTGLEPA